MDDSRTAQHRDDHIGPVEIARETFWIFALAAIAFFAFFYMLGAFSISEVWKPTIVIAILSAMWIGHAVREHRLGGEANSQALRRIRERRGY
jgi:hypothetical protein